MDGIISYQLYCYITILLISLSTRGLFAISIELSTPVNPVEQEGILSVHCQVRHLNSEDHEVNILRTMTSSKKTEKLSVDEGVLQGVDDRVFLAVRKLVDGSTVYFLSITEVSRADEGEYFCKVLTKGTTISEVGSESKTIGVTYYPGDSDPVCSPMDVQQFTYHVGDSLTLNCSSESANPPVSLQWSSTSNPHLDLEPNVYSHNGMVYSVLQLKLRRKDDNAVFLCKMTSDMFPTREQTCHVGPLRVIPTGNTPDGNRPSLTDSGSRTELTTETIDSKLDISNTKDITEGVDYSDCQSVCPVKSRVMYWVAATVIAGALSILFFIITIALLIKYIHAPRVQRTHYMSARQTPEGIYSELECRRMGEGGKVYMSLDKSGKPPDLESMQRLYGLHYHEMPSAPVVKVPASPAS